MDNLLIAGICGVLWIGAVVLIVLFFMGAYSKETPSLKGSDNGNL